MREEQDFLKQDFLKHTAALRELMRSGVGSLALRSMLARDICLFVALLSLCLPGTGASLNADEPAPMTISESFEKQIQPLLVRSCGKCHGKKPKDNDLDLTSFSSAQAILARPKMLSHVAERVRGGDMPPKDAPQPDQAQRKQLLGWITAALDAEADARAGDPGPVTLRRLSNTEYDNAIRDLTGVDMRPTQAREFPIDSVGGEGFANVGEAMPVTPELVQRYHQAARDVAARAVLLPQGFRFSPSPDRPTWTAETLKSLRSFHARYAGPNGEPPLAAHLAATLRHRDIPMLIPSASTVSRRTMLRGLGVSMALPWLESLRFATAAIPAAADQPPTRTLVTFTGMGFHSEHWWAKGEGDAMELGPCLKPLEPWKQQLVFLRGLWNEQANNGVIHCMQTGNMLSGAPMSKTEVRTGVSFDQLMAQRIGDRTRLPSLVLGCEGPIPGLQDGHPLLYSSHVSWSTAVSPTWTETRPALAFDQLFRTKPNRGDLRVVDAVLEDARSLRQRLSVSDRQRFEEYLGSVHEIEGRIKRAGQDREPGSWKPSLTAPDRPRPADGIPAEIPDYWKLMNDIVLLAFRTDSTRIATLKYCNDGSILTHAHAGAKDQHHQMAHNQPAELVAVNQFFTSQLAYLCKRMAEVKEGESSLLDNTTIMHCSSMIHGNHDSKQLPVVLLGGAGGKLRGGRAIDYLNAPNRRMCSLFLSLMEWGGLELDRFGFGGAVDRHLIGHYAGQWRRSYSPQPRRPIPARSHFP